jgi:hypothetical protein
MRPFRTGGEFKALVGIVCFGIGSIKSSSGLYIVQIVKVVHERA